MKFKYMLRGLGIGVIITACVMGAYTRNAVADARVTVLKQYGLGGEVAEEESQAQEESASAEITEAVLVRDEEAEAEISSVLESAKAAEEAARAESDAANAEADAAMPEEEGVMATVPEPQAGEGAETAQQEPSSGAIVVEPSSDVAAAEPSDTEGNFPDEADVASVEIVIAKGDDSGTVSRKLYNAGLIENAAEYDAFLMQHGYDKKLNTGTKVIYATDTWQEIAEKLTKK